jgi:hypothetical protein
VADEVGIIKVEIDDSELERFLKKYSGSSSAEIKVTADTKEAESEIKSVKKQAEKPATVKVDADTKNAKSDVKNLDKQISSLDQTVKIKADVSEVKAKIKDVGGQLKDAFSGGGGLGNITGGISALGGQLAGLAGPVGIAATAVVGLGAALANVVAETAELQRQVSQLTGLQGDQLTDLTADIQAVADVFEQDFNETLVAANTLAKEFKITQSDALAVIEEQFLNGADASGELLAQVKEYPGFFREAGFSAKEFGDFIALSTKEGIFSDKGADLVKEFGLRIRELTPAAKDALAGIGLSGDALQEALISGEKTQKDVLEEIANRLGDFSEQSTEVGTVIADVFGGPGEDAGLRFIKLLGDIEGSLGSAKKAGDPFLEQQKAQLELSKLWNQAIGSLTQTVMPVFSSIMTALADAATFLVEGFKSFLETIRPVTTIIKDSLVRVFTSLWDIVSAVFSVFESLWPVIKFAFIPIIIALGAALAPVIAILYTFSQVLSLIAEGVQIVAKWLTTTLEPAIKTVAGFLNELVDGFLGAVKAVGDFLGLTDDAGDKVAPLNKEYKDMTENLGDLSKETVKVNKELERQGTAILPPLVKEAGKVNETLDDMIKRLVKLDPASQAFETLFNRAAKLSQEQQTLTFQINKTKEAIDKANESVEKYPTAINKGIEANQGFVFTLNKINTDLVDTSNNFAGFAESIKQTADNTTLLSNVIDALANNNIGELLGAFDKVNAGYDNLNDQQKAVFDTTLQLGNVFADTFESILTRQQTFLQGLATLLLDGIQLVANAMLAEALARSLAQADSIATFGVTGLLRFAGIAALINGGIAGFKAAISGFKEGGYTGDGGSLDVAGLVHKGEYVSTADITARERPLLDFMHSGGTSMEYFTENYSDILKPDIVPIGGTVNHTYQGYDFTSMEKNINTIKNATVHTAETNETISKKNMNVTIKNNRVKSLVNR